jgi:hypothetical protein
LPRSSPSLKGLLPLLESNFYLPFTMLTVLNLTCDALHSEHDHIQANEEAQFQSGSFGQ